MTFSKIGRAVLAAVATVSLGLGMTACGGGTVAYIWVMGSFYNQITGFLVDNYTGNLTGIIHSPFASGGSNPVDMVVRTGGRYVYVINSGTGQVGVPGQTGYVGPTGAAITEFSVGNGGILTYQQNFSSQGTTPVWAAIDSGGNYLYVLDKYSPDYATTGNGSLTAFSIAGDTGRLTLIPNTTILNNGIAQTWFDVGPNPIMTKFGPGGCLYTLSPTSIYPYAVNVGSGQLTVATTGAYQVTGASNLSSINTSQGTSAASYTFLTDKTNNAIYTLQSGGSGCSLTQVSGSQQSNVSGTANPVNSITSTSGKFLYVLNQSNTSPTGNANSSISAFTINTQGQIATLADSTNNPYAVGSGPVCIVQDPTNQYLYISNSNDSTVTGKLLDQNRGYLTNLQRGSVFPTTKTPTCMAISGNI